MISVDVECDNPDCPGDESGASPNGDLIDVYMGQFGGNGGHISQYLPEGWTVQPSEGGVVRVFCPRCSKGAEGE